MPVPPQFLRKASKRRIDASATPVSKNGKNSKKVATFQNPGNKAGKGLMQQAGPGVGAPNPDADASADTGNFLGLLAAMGGSKKPKTKVQPAAGRRFAAIKMATKK